MTSIVGEFDGYKFRSPEESDRATLKQWIKATLMHDCIAPEFFMDQTFYKSLFTIYRRCMAEVSTQSYALTTAGR
jgi:hypothetical protein